MVRGEVDEAARLLGLMVDKVPSVEQAKRYISLGMPHLIIIDERLNDDSFGRLQNDITSTDPNMGFIEIADESNTFEISSWMSDSMTRVSRDVMRAQLPSVLTLELARAL
jgi:DNA-binding NtrC family response regulator